MLVVQCALHLQPFRSRRQGPRGVRFIGFTCLLPLLQLSAFRCHILQTQHNLGLPPRGSMCLSGRGWATIEHGRCCRRSRVPVLTKSRGIVD
jgi:hypothetical protein